HEILESRHIDESDLSNNLAQQKEFDRKHKKWKKQKTRTITPITKIKVDDGIILLFQSTLDKEKKFKKSRYLHHRVDIQVKCQITYDNFVFPQPSLDKFNDVYKGQDIRKYLKTINIINPNDERLHYFWADSRDNK
ncbi:hypothetical protein, partial [Vibrio aerogenes]